MQVEGYYTGMPIIQPKAVETKPESKIPPPPPPFPPKEEWPTDPKAFAGRLAFYAITKNLEKQTIEAILKAGKIPSKMQELALALQHNDLNHPIFQDHDAYPPIALAAVREGLISREQFSTLMWRRSALLANGSIIDVPLFINGQVNPQAKAIIKETLQVHPLVQSTLIVDFLSEEELDQFFEQMRSKPLSEQRFFYVPDKYPPPDPFTSNRIKDIVEGTRTISHEVQQNAGFNVFGRFGGDKRMGPSASMMQTFLDLKFGKNSAKLNYVLGESSLEAIIKNGLLGTREMGLPFPGLPVPRRADDTLAPDIDFPWHDFYHAYLVSTIPDNHRLAFCQVASLIDSLRSHPDFAPHATFLENWKERVIDMEFPSYQPNSILAQRDRAEMFWRDLSTSVATTKFQKSVHDAVEKKNTQASLDISFMFEGHKEIAAINAVFEAIVKNKQNWEELTGISFDALRRSAALMKQEMIQDYKNADLYGYMSIVRGGMQKMVHRRMKVPHPLFSWKKSLKQFTPAA